jgi:hypothetical protein
MKNNKQSDLASTQDNNVALFKELKGNPDLFVDKLITYGDLTTNEQKVVRTKLTDKQSEKMFSFLERTLVMKEISKVDLAHKDNADKNTEYTSLIENLYSRDYEKINKLMDLKLEDEEKFLREIRDKKNQDLLASFVDLDKVKGYKNEDGSVDTEKMFSEITKSTLHEIAKKPEDYIFERHFDDDVFSKISNIFKEQVNIVNLKIDDKIKDGTNFDKQGGKLQRNDAILKAAQTELEMKILTSAIKIAVNPALGTAMVVGGLIAKSKTFKRFSEKIKKTINSKLENSEKFKSFRAKNPWVDKLRKNKKIRLTAKIVGVCFVGGLAASMGSDLAVDALNDPSGTVDSLKSNAVNAIDSGISTVQGFTDKAGEVVNDFYGNSEASNIESADVEKVDDIKDVSENSNKVGANGVAPVHESMVKGGGSYTFVGGDEINTLSEAVDSNLSGILNELNSVDGVNMSFNDLIKYTAEMNNIENIHKVDVGQEITFPTKEQFIEMHLNQSTVNVDTQVIGDTKKDLLNGVDKYASVNKLASKGKLIP